LTIERFFRFPGTKCQVLGHGGGCDMEVEVEGRRRGGDIGGRCGGGTVVEGRGRRGKRWWRRTVRPGEPEGSGSEGARPGPCGFVEGVAAVEGTRRHGGSGRMEDGGAVQGGVY